MCLCVRPFVPLHRIWACSALPMCTHVSVLVFVSVRVYVGLREWVAFFYLHHKQFKSPSDRLHSWTDSASKERGPFLLCPSKLQEYCCWRGGRMSEHKDVHCFALHAVTKVAAEWKDSLQDPVTVVLWSSHNSFILATSSMIQHQRHHSDTVVLPLKESSTEKTQTYIRSFLLTSAKTCMVVHLLWSYDASVAPRHMRLC